MIQEQARIEAERRVEEFSKLSNSTMPCTYDVQCALISINREIELLERISKNTNIISTIFSELQDLYQIKDELLKM